MKYTNKRVCTADCRGHMKVLFMYRTTNVSLPGSCEQGCTAIHKVVYSVLSYFGRNRGTNRQNVYML